MTGEAKPALEIGYTRFPWIRGMTRNVILAAITVTVALVVGASVVEPRAVRNRAADAAARVLLAVVPGGQPGVYRHGTYPSSGKRTHVGVDIVAPCGTPVLALEDGTVVDRIASRSDPDFTSLGYMVILEHPASITDRVFYSLHLHLQSPPVAAEHVARGDELGRVGATGRATGCHLHLEVRYFRDRVSHLWKNIYGPGDQRLSRHFRDNWEDPLAFIARIEGRRQSVDSYRPAQWIPGRPRPS